MTRRRVIESRITKAQADKYELLFPMLDAVFVEMKELSKNKQDDSLNKIKVSMINNILEQIKDILSDDPSIQFLELLDDEMLPTNSDTVLILAQFRAAMVSFRGKYFG